MKKEKILGCGLDQSTVADHTKKLTLLCDAIPKIEKSLEKIYKKLYIDNGDLSIQTKISIHENSIKSIDEKLEKKEKNTWKYAGYIMMIFCMIITSSVSIYIAKNYNKNEINMTKIKNEIKQIIKKNQVNQVVIYENENYRDNE